MNKELELEIRRSYSKHQKSFKALELWVKNTFGEIKFHDPTIYDFQIRTKEIESLIKKIKKRSSSDKNPKHYEDFNDVAKDTVDIVGARLIVFGPDSIRRMHAHILSHKRIDIERVKLHSYKNYKSKEFQDIQKNIPHHLGSPEIEENETGYMGVHYTLRAKPCDGVYSVDVEKEVPKLYPRFELQLRTIMYHAWSEIQHKVIYKGQEGNYDDLLGQFAFLSPIIAQCDSSLAGLMRKKSLAPSMFEADDNMQNIIREDYRKVLNKIKSTLTDYENNGTSLEDRYKITEKLANEFESTINDLDKSETAIDIRAELGELYLKSGRPRAAIAEYGKVIKHTHRSSLKLMIYLRMAEAYSFLSDSENCIVFLEKIHETIEKKSNLEILDPKILYAGTAYLWWKVNEFTYAKIYGELSYDFIKEEPINTPQNLKIAANYIYYCLDYFQENNEQSSEENFEKLQVLIDKIIKDSQIYNINITSFYLDTIAWFYYKKSKLNIVLRESYCDDNAKNYAEKAKMYITKCLEKAENNESNFSDSWILHKFSIDELLNEIEQCNKNRNPM